MKSVSDNTLSSDTNITEDMDEHGWVITPDVMTEEAESLIESYQVLKSDYPHNDEEIKSIFVQLMDSCPKKVTQFWHALIKQKFPKIVKGGYDDRDEIDYSYILMNGILYAMQKEDGFEKLMPHLLQDDLIFPTMYRYGDIDYTPEEILADIIFHNEYEKAEEYLNLAAKNRLYDGSDKDRKLPLQAVIEYYGKIFKNAEDDILTWGPSPEDKKALAMLEKKYPAAKEFFERHMSKVTNRTWKAKLNVVYLQMKKTIEKNWPEFEED